MLSHIRYVFHRDQLRLDLADQAGEMIKQRPFAVGAGIAPLVVSGEGLAGGAASKQAVATFSSPWVPGVQLLLGEIFDVFGYENCIIVDFVGVLALGLNVVASVNVDTSITHASG
ncbi:hypothetical protein HMPREF2914_14110 [Pseudomonas sp. HMSC067G02]|nr:hypothetical protein X778_13230 [Pseudomonas aeruginosa VRFPA07]OES48836.1 hypothetical protein A7R78_11810 [Pseudomonas aeruginosa]OFQ97123.1 hypothetical protein HMPREF2914_14110 [Pseudomonas sp. HMSC067G02]